MGVTGCHGSHAPSALGVCEADVVFRSGYLWQSGLIGRDSEALMQDRGCVFSWTLHLEEEPRKVYGIWQWFK